MLPKERSLSQRQHLSMDYLHHTHPCMGHPSHDNRGRSMKIIPKDCLQLGCQGSTAWSLEHQPREKKVKHKDRQQHGHNGRGRRLPYAFGSSSGG